MTAEDTRIKNMLVAALTDVFGVNEQAKKFVDVSRIPLICKSIIDINTKLEALDIYIKNDNNWKKEFDMWKTSIVEPLVQKESNDAIVRIWQVKELKMLAGMAGGAVAVYLAVHYWGFLIGVHI